MMDYDIVVIGGGIVGLAFACAFRDSNRRVLVAERGDLDASITKEYDIVVNTINLGSERFLSNIGAWNNVENFRACPFRAIEVWGESVGRIEFLAGEIGEDRMGHIVERSVLLSALLDIARNSEAIELQTGKLLQSIESQGNSVDVHFEDGSRVNASMVVGADGGDSMVRRCAGIQAQISEYQQTAIVAKIETSEPHCHTSFQRFLHTGPLAFLPLDDGSSSIVWTLSNKQALELLSVPEVEFCEILAKKLDNRLGTTKLASERASFALRRMQADSYQSDRTVLIGDAAHVIHPLAGMGVNLGLMDAASLAQIVNSSQKSETDIWELRQIRKFERWRKAANQPMMSVVHGFNLGFNKFAPLLPAVSGFGLSVTNSLGSVKHRIMKYACGITGDLPESAKKEDAADQQLGFLKSVLLREH